MLSDMNIFPALLNDHISVASCFIYRATFTGVLSNARILHHHLLLFANEIAER